MMVESWSTTQDVPVVDMNETVVENRMRLNFKYVMCVLEQHV